MTQATTHNPNQIRTAIWEEIAEDDNPFATRAAYCHGYDVYGEMVGRAGWADMLFLLLRGDAPTAPQKALLEALAVALANPGPRDASIHAAMCGGVAGSTAAATLSAALAVGAGANGGAREVSLAMQAWQDCGADLASWQRHLDQPADSGASIWPAPGHVPGFDPHGRSCSGIVRAALERLQHCGGGVHLGWLHAQRTALETLAGRPLAMTGVAAAALLDLGLSAQQGEMLFLLLRLPGAAAHALEQGQSGFRHFPFYTVEVQA